MAHLKYYRFLLSFVDPSDATCNEDKKTTRPCRRYVGRVDLPHLLHRQCDQMDKLYRGTQIDRIVRLTIWRIDVKKIIFYKYKTSTLTPLCKTTCHVATSTKRTKN